MSAARGEGLIVDHQGRPTTIERELSQLGQCLKRAHKALAPGDPVKLDIDGAFGCLFALQTILQVRATGTEKGGSGG